MAVGLGVLLVSITIKMLFYSKIKLEDMTIKNNSSNKSSEPT